MSLGHRLPKNKILKTVNVLYKGVHFNNYVLLV